MRERINRLAKGHIDYGEVEAAFSETKIEDTVLLDEKKREEFRVVCTRGKSVKGLVYSTNQRVSLFSGNFVGKDCRIIYEVDASYAEGDIEGEFQIVCSAGEFRIPYRFRVCAVSGENGASTLEEFAAMARENGEEALRFFESADFRKCPFMEDAGLRTLYESVWGRGDRHEGLEQFLAGAGAKEPVTVSIKEEPADYQYPREDISGTVTLMRSGWGYLRLAVSADVPWLSFQKNELTDKDFEGNRCLLGCRVRLDRLHAGKNQGRITVRGLFGTLTAQVSVTARSNRAWAQEQAYKRDFYNFALQYIKAETGLYERELLLNGMQTSLARALPEAPEPARIRLYQADIALKQERAEAASQFLEEAKERVLDNRDVDVESYCYYMYLKALTDREPARMQTAVKLLRRYYEEGTAQDMSLFILMQADEELLENDSLALSRLKEHFRNGCRSPYLYLAACRLYEKKPELLRVMEEFEVQSLWFGARYRLISEKTAVSAAMLAIQVKKGRRLCLRLLKELYSLYPGKELLTAVCALFIRSDGRGREAFSWYEKGVREDIHLTRLYEYYLYALPKDHEGPLPRILLLYFSLNHTLDYRTQAALYLNVLTYLSEDEEIYKAYEGQIEAFAVEQLFQSHINSDLAKIYTRMIYPEMVDERIARVLPKLLYARRITCDNPDMRQVVLCYEEMKGETTVSLRGGRAYIPVYSDHIRVLFQDDRGTRYSCVPFTMEEMMDCPALKERTAKLYPSHEMLKLRRCLGILEKGSLNADDIEVLKDMSQEEMIAGPFRRRLVSEIVSYYYGREETAECDEYLLDIDKKLLKPEDRLKVMDALITKDYYEEAYKMAVKYGYRSLSMSRLMKLTSRMILKKLFEQDGFLLEMAWYCFEKRRHDDVILEYLACHYNGLSVPMYQLLSAASSGHTALYDLPERLLGQMLFDGTFSHLDRVFRCYIQGRSVDESLVKAYLAVKSSRYFEGNEPYDSDVLNYIEAQTEKSDIRRGVPEICMLALTKYYSMADRLSKKQAELCQQLVDELCRRKIIFGYFKSLSRFIRLPGELLGKTVIEYRGRKDQHIWIHERLLPDGGEPVVETMPHIFGGYFVKLVSLFYGESLEYELYDDGGGADPVAKGTALYGGGSDEPGSRAGRLDAVLKAQAFAADDLKEQMERYAVRDEITERLFEYL